MKLLTMSLVTVAMTAVTVAAMAGAAGGVGSVELAVDARKNANASVTADGQFVVVVWGASTEAGLTDVYSAVSRDAGRTFGRPVRVSGTEGKTNLSGEQPPKVTLLRRAGLEPVVSVIWTAKAATGTTLFQTRSNDGGRTYGRATPIAGGGGEGNRGWETTAVDARGRVSVVWLDHREHAQMQAKAGAAPHEHHHEESATGVPAPSTASKTDTSVMAQMSKLYIARLDGSIDAHPVASGVCYCCKTALAAGADGSLYAAWRHVYPGNIRDIAFGVSRDGGRTFAPSIRVSADNWELNGCPENGPALAVDKGRRAHVVWPTLVKNSAPGGEPNLALFYAVSADGKPFTSRQKLPAEGTPNHVQIALTDDDSLIAVWEEAADSSRRVVMARAALGGPGEPRFTRTIVNGGVRAVYPVVAAASDAAILAWTSGVSSTIHVERRPRS